MIDMARHHYGTQKSTAKRRGIPFLLTFKQWLKIWESSGHLHERGKRFGKYCMARHGDKGAYELGNVKIEMCNKNNRDAKLNQSDAARKRMRNSLKRYWKSKRGLSRRAEMSNRS